MSKHFIPGAIRFPEPSVADRLIPTASKGHCNSDIVIDGRQIHLESNLELMSLLCLNVIPGIVALREQQVFDWFDHDGEVHEHYCDLVADHDDGTTVAYAVRPAARMTLSYESELAIIRRQAIDAGFVDDLRVLTEDAFDGASIFNATLLHGSRQPDPSVDEIARTVIRQMSGVATVSDLQARIAMGGSGFRAIVRLIGAGVLAPVRNERITHTTLLLKKGTI